LSKARLTRLFLEELNDEALEHLRHDWPLWARLKQRPPLCDWRTWLILGGRGAGKTRTGAEWIKGVALADPHQPGHSGGRIALVGSDEADVRSVMIEGESGLLRLHTRSERPLWYPSRRELIWPNGTVASVFSSADPEGLRGSQFGAAWCDEICKWRNRQATWDMLQFGLRIGNSPRQVVTTTPKPIGLLKKLLADPSTVSVRAPTRENAANLAGEFLAYVEATYGATSLGRQELEGEIIESNAHALWRHHALEKGRVTSPPKLGRIVVAVDPPASSNKRSDACGIVAAGEGRDGYFYVLADETVQGVGPDRWAARAIGLYHELGADLVLAEVNQGGDMVKTILNTLDPTVPVRGVHASRGKWLRAEPVALLYEQGRVRHVGCFKQLEDQMCALGPDGRSRGASPDRLDALVWAITELALSNRATPRVRRA